MRSIHAVPLLLSVLVGLLLALMAWGFWRVRSHQANGTLAGSRDGVLLGLLILAALALGIFLTYALLNLSLWG